jgi:hypothetical protein
VAGISTTAAVVAREDPLPLWVSVYSVRWRYEKGIEESTRVSEFMQNHAMIWIVKRLSLLNEAKYGHSVTRKQEELKRTPTAIAAKRRAVDE